MNNYKLRELLINMTKFESKERWDCKRIIEAINSIEKEPLHLFDISDN